MSKDLLGCIFEGFCRIVCIGYAEICYLFRRRENGGNGVLVMMFNFDRVTVVNIFDSCAI